MKAKFGSLRWQLVLFSCVAVILSLGIVVSVSADSTSTVSEAKATAAAVDRLSGVGAAVEGRILRAGERAAMLARVLAGIKDPEIALDLGREPIIGMLKKSLLEAEDLLGVYTAWETDALDGMDIGYADTEGHDATGRFFPLVRRDAEGNPELIASPDMSAAVKSEQNGSPAYLRSLTLPGKLVAMSPVVSDARYEGRGGVDLLFAIQGTEEEGPVGTVGVTLDFERITSLVRTEDLEKLGASVALLDRDGSMKFSWGDATESITRPSEAALAAMRQGSAHCAPVGDYLQAVVPVDLEGVDGGLVLQAAIPLSGVYAESQAATQRLILVGLIALLVNMAFIVWIVRRALSPLDTLNSALEDISQGGGDLTHRLEEVGAVELRSLSVSFNRFVANLADMMRQISERSQSLAKGSTEASEFSERLSRQVEAASSETGEAASGAERISSDITGVSTNLDEMAQAIGEIATQAAAAMNVTGEASGKLEENDRSIASLGDKSQEIAQFVKVINGISEQTNLLALNATIEAARAGESGKGFAVVANEVKELANQAAVATDDIRALIEDIQREVEGAVAVGREVDEVFSGITEISATIATAVEEQTAVTGEVRTVLSRITEEVGHVSEAVRSAAGNTASAEREAETTKEGAQAACTDAEALEKLVGTFRF